MPEVTPQQTNILKLIYLGYIRVVGPLRPLDKPSIRVLLASFTTCQQKAVIDGDN